VRLVQPDGMMDRVCCFLCGLLPVYRTHTPAILGYVCAGYMICVGVMCILVAYHTKVKLQKFKGTASCLYTVALRSMTDILLCPLAKDVLRATMPRDGTSDKEYVKSLFDKYASNRGFMNAGDLVQVFIHC